MDIIYTIRKNKRRGKGKRVGNDLGSDEEFVEKQSKMGIFG